MKHTMNPWLYCLIFLLMFYQWAGAQTADDFKPAASNIRGAECPMISGDLSVRLQLNAPDAMKVQVAGNLTPNAEIVDMTKDAEGNWTVTIPSVVRGFHYYWFLVDGVQVNDPGSDTYFGFNRPTSGIEVPTAGEDFFLPADVPHDEVREHWYYSDITGEWRKSFVYTPPDYDTNVDRKYPVLYLLHGGGENERGWSKQGHVNFIMDNLIEAGKAVPMVVLMNCGYATDKNALLTSTTTIDRNKQDAC